MPNEKATCPAELVDRYLLTPTIPIEVWFAGSQQAPADAEEFVKASRYERFHRPVDYCDSAGNKCSLNTLCRKEPDWAANRLRAELDEILRLQGEVEVLSRQHAAAAEGLQAIYEAIGNVYGRTDDLWTQPCVPDAAVADVLELRAQRDEERRRVGRLEAELEQLQAKLDAQNQTSTVMRQRIEKHLTFLLEEINGAECIASDVPTREFLRDQVDAIDAAIHRPLEDAR